jgi:hypothetical protein
MIQITISVDDRQWPNLQMVMTTKDVNGAPTADVKSALYDTAYTQFEVMVQNRLRALVQSLSQRRLGK